MQSYLTRGHQPQMHNNYNSFFRMNPNRNKSRHESSPQEGLIERTRILVAMKANGMQLDLAELSGIDSTTMSRLLAGHKPFLKKHLFKLAKSTGVRLEWLTKGIEPMFPVDGPEQLDEMSYHEGSLLRAYLENNNISKKSLADLLGKSENTVQSYFKSAEIKKNKGPILAALNATDADVFGVEGLRAPLQNRIQPINLIDTSTSINVLTIPKTAREGAGYTAYLNLPMSDREFTEVPPSMLFEGVKADQHVIVEINGDNMEPELKSGYRMLAYRLAPNELPKLNSIVCIEYRGEFIVKELSGIDDVSNAIELRSKNGGATRRVALAEVQAVYHIYRYYYAQL